MSPRYFLRIRGARVLGSIELPVSTLVAAKSLGASWKEALTGTASRFTLEITNEKGELEWTL